MFEPNVRHRSAALAEPKPTPREVAEKLMVGIVLHDNRNTLAEGWAFLPHREPFRVRGLFDLRKWGSAARMMRGCAVSITAMPLAQASS